MRQLPFHRDRQNDRRVLALFASTNKTASENFDDAEFGEIKVRRNAQSRTVRLRLSAHGELVVTMPPRVSLQHARQLVDQSRADVRTWQASHRQEHPVYEDGARIGHSHTLRLVPVERAAPKAMRRGLEIIVEYPKNLPPEHETVQQTAREYIRSSLQKQARAYLPRRLKALAGQHGFSYERVRFGTQKGRWGSCSSTGTISLNVALMNQSLEEIDYVLIHELCHTKQMNHSSAFWALVEQCMPAYKIHRKSLKNAHPTH